MTIIFMPPLTTGFGGTLGRGLELTAEMVAGLKEGGVFATVHHNGERGFLSFPWRARVWRMRADGIPPREFDWLDNDVACTRRGARRQAKRMLRVWSGPATAEIYRLR